MSDSAPIKIIQKINENPLYWDIKKKNFEEFKNSYNQSLKSEENFQKSIKKSDLEKKLTNLIKEISNSAKNIFNDQVGDDPIIYINEYKKKWFEFLNNQYCHLCQNYYVLSSESKDDTIYFYNDQALLNFISKIQNSQSVMFKTVQNENSLLKMGMQSQIIDFQTIQKNYCFEKLNEDKEKIIENMLEKNVIK